MGALTSCLAARLHDLSSPRPPGGVTVSILTGRKKVATFVNQETTDQLHFLLILVLQIITLCFILTDVTGTFVSQETTDLLHFLQILISQIIVLCFS